MSLPNSDITIIPVRLDDGQLSSRQPVRNPGPVQYRTCYVAELYSRIAVGWHSRDMLKLFRYLNFSHARRVKPLS